MARRQRLAREGRRRERRRAMTKWWRVERRALGTSSCCLCARGTFFYLWVSEGVQARRELITQRRNGRFERSSSCALHATGFCFGWGKGCM